MPPRRNGHVGLIEQGAELWAPERTRALRGRYHVLGGMLSALDGGAPEDLAMPKLKGAKHPNDNRVRRARSAQYSPSRLGDFVVK